ELPGGALTAERLLRDALAPAPADAVQPEPTDAAQAEARRWLTAALAMQGKGGHADELLDTLSPQPAEQLALLDVLAQVRQRQPAEATRLAELESRVQNRLLQRRTEL